MSHSSFLALGPGNKSQDDRGASLAKPMASERVTRHYCSRCSSGPQIVGPFGDLAALNDENADNLEVLIRLAGHRQRIDSCVYDHRTFGIGGENFDGDLLAMAQKTLEGCSHGNGADRWRLVF